MASETPAVALDSVTRRYGDTTALKGVSLSVREGEFFTLVGPSGCGKTTTLRLLAGFETPTHGTVRFGGESVAGVPPEERDVGVVFQNYALFPHMSVGENVAYGLRFTDPPGGVTRDERVSTLLELVDLGGTEDRDPDTLSGGQQQRVAMARALAPGPDLLLLDEPMSALDAKLRERLRVQVREIQRELGITTVYVTHDQEEALAVSDRVAVVRDGYIEQVGTPREIYREPATRFVASFIGDNNVLSGEVTDVGVGADGPAATVAVGGESLGVGLDSRDGVAVGDRLTFCLRPERLSLSGGETTLSATVTSTEFLGETTRAHLDWGGETLRLRTTDPPDGDVVVGFDPADAHVVAVDR
ncbi:ABC transporter ATP-binding protein [Haloarcula sp. JP-L23]|uniref:ABC transporter ATP-binding protein n=1 Tax=Haloarcula sp. JP-L23 TaxID=2716717 RepID=UPI00140EAF03|nr:ABC transporter ATP-binding protein [Haloarcula sp. JP-L23]